MKRSAFCIVLVLAVSAFAQQPAAPIPNNSMSKSLGLHVFPAKNQISTQQTQDEAACYSWATQDSGFDPVAAVATQPSSTSPPSTQQPNTQGAGGGGAATGAAKGAVLGAVAGDAGKGAAIGAAGGRMRARQKAQQQQQQQQQQRQQQVQQQNQAKAQTQQKLESFKKAFSACMEGKGYVVK